MKKLLFSGIENSIITDLLLALLYLELGSGRFAIDSWVRIKLDI